MKLIATSRLAQEQSEIAIRASLRLLREPTYPAIALAWRKVIPDKRMEMGDDGDGNEGRRRDRGIVR